MKVRVLGTAAGGGAPQWNCACATCVRARGAGASRTQDCLAVSGDGQSWYLVNASPDLRVQLLAAPELAPGPGVRDTPLRGVLLTSAELDHTIGLLSLREARSATGYATAAVLHALTDAFGLPDLVAPYAPGFGWRTVRPAAPFELDGGLLVTALPLGSKRPRYAAAVDLDQDHVGGPAEDWVVAYRFEDLRTSGVLVYAPCLAAWTDTFDGYLDGAGWLVVDGTFFSVDEFARVTGGSSGGMGHAPITATLPRLAAHPDLRVLYTHLNNTNPVQFPDTPEYAAVRAAGADVPADGQLLDI